MACFPTVRGKSWFKKVLPDDKVKIIEEATNLISEGTVLSTRLWRIEDLSYNFIRSDGSYGTKFITDHHEFVDLLNSFRRFHPIQSIEEKVTVIWILKGKT